MKSEAKMEPDAENGEENRARTRVFVFIFLGLLVLGGVYGLFHYLTYGRYVESTNDAYLRADIIEVAPKLPGYVEQVLVADNQAVKAGDPLVRISGIDTASQAAQLTAELAAAQAMVAQSISRVYSQDAAILAARADEMDARSRVDYLQGEVKRYEPLTRSGAESGEKLAQLRQQRDGAQAGLARAGAQAVLAAQQRDAAAAEVDGAHARVAAIRAQQQRANSDVALSVLRSSINGRIGDSGVRVGQYVRPGQRLMSVVPVEHIYVVANFKETQVRRMRIGQKVDIVLDALADEPLKGRVESFSPGTGSVFALLPPQNATGNFTKIVQRVPVRIKLDGAMPAGRVIVPGMSVVASVDTRDNKN
ncbi:HlyD family secretion protein [Aquisediminimonas sediminicola]|uniref:HlyD family secretion protein n=1 Tax=Alteraquisediminimonas sediminicola TaxID=2676787 RepID=UPI001C8E7D24